MHCFASAISILIIYLFPTTIAKEPVKLVEDDEFLAFVKDPSNFWQRKELEERNEVEYCTPQLTFGFKKMREHLIHKSEAYLGVLYLMRQNWQCAKIAEQFNEEHKRECHKFRKYLDILYEYLFGVNVGGVDAMPPNFKLHRGENMYDKTLFDVIKSLSKISRFFFDSKESIRSKFSLKKLFESYDEPKLLNDKKYETNDANSNGTLRQQFDVELKRMAKETKKRYQKENNEIIKERKQIDKENQRERKTRWNREKASSDKFNIFVLSPFNRSIILLDDLDLLLALFHEPPKFYEILKMAKKLGEMDDDFHIFLNSSDLKRISKRLNQKEEPIEKIEIQIENEFCALAFFVGDLLKTAKLVESGNLILMPNTMTKKDRKEDSIDDIGNFLKKKKELCKEKQKQKEIEKYLDGKDLYNRKTPKVNLNPLSDLKHIIPEIVDEIEQMLQKSDWNYANLKYLKMDEWNLLEFVLHKVGNAQKWEEIDKLRGEWEQAFSNWWKSTKNEKNRPNFEEMMGNLIKKLSNMINDSVVLRAMERAKIA